ncbi:MAG: PIG-L family deacetylase [Clostridiales bacterium]|jgi:LmbE family N-acetylglucosaminyl deacetylase|nr:PIG-L family deacetylase [Clostridiales bacterium]
MSALDDFLAAPGIDDIKRALFIQPHPDDNQIGAGGLIAKLVQKGAEVYELTVCDDRFVDIGYNGEGFTTRQKETLEAQKCLGMKNAGFLGFADKTRAGVEEISEAIVSVIRDIKPDAVFSADSSVSNECHSDHIKVGQAVKYACMDAECNFYPNLIDGKLRDDAYLVPMLGFYYTDKPNTIIDITEYYDKKTEAIGCHESQVSMPLMFAIGALAGKWGEQKGYEYAEAFKIIGSIHMHCYPFEVLGNV